MKQCLTHKLIQSHLVDGRLVAGEEISLPTDWITCDDIAAPPAAAAAAKIIVERGPNISTIPDILPVADRIDAPVALHLGDNISTDYISPAGARALPFRSNIPKIAEMSFDNIDPDYAGRWRTRALAGRFHAIVAGHNYGQGSSREHAAIAPQYLGLRLVLAKSFARLHWQNLINSAILPLVFDDPGDHDHIAAGDQIMVDGISRRLSSGESRFEISLPARGITMTASLTASPRQIAILRAGGFANWIRMRH